VARTWLRIRVDLIEGLGVRLDPAPGRIFIVGPGHTFEQLAEAIDAAFARWDVSHLHLFQLSDGRRIGYPDDGQLGTSWLDHGALKVAREVRPGESFTYVFDLGDDWRHHCTVFEEKADPVEEYGLAPKRPAVLWGWGTIPDQYGRVSFDDLDPDD
jgi:Plasmid pRiA4b ORF-3-like protein